MTSDEHSGGQLHAPGRCRQGRRWGVTTFAAAVALCSTACAPLALVGDAPGQPPTVTLPVVMAGVRDERPAFTQLFQRELQAAGKTAGAAVSSWLHTEGSDAERANEDLQRLDAAFAAHAATTTVLVVPGMFGDCVAAQSVPFGDGALRTKPYDPADPYRQYDDLGLHGIRLLPVPGRASTAANGRLLASAIREEARRADGRTLVLIGYSKGVPDILEALAAMQREAGVPHNVKAVVSVAGAVMGSPVADRFAGVYASLSPHVSPLDCTPSRGDELLSLGRKERSAWLARNRLPPGIRYYSVVAYARSDETALPLRVTGRLLAAIDPRNDGQLLASDAILPHSTLLAEARADHWDVALPRDRHPEYSTRILTSGRAYPREALFRAVLRWVVAADR